MNRKTLAGLVAGVLAGTIGGPVIMADAHPNRTGERSVSIPKRPCSGPDDYAGCFYDAGVSDFRGEHSHWAREFPSHYAGAVYRCVRFLDPKVNRRQGGCGHFTAS